MLRDLPSPKNVSVANVVKRDSVGVHMEGEESARRGQVFVREDEGAGRL